MSPTFSQPRVVIRPSLPSDTPDVLEFCKTIWDGQDYVPYVWDDWLADPQARMFTAEYAGHAVGVARLSEVAPGQWWLEGFRVDPQHQDKKIGSQLHRHLVDWWLEHGTGVIRLWTSSERVKVHHLCAQTGLVKTLERATYTAAPLPAAETPFTPLLPTESVAAAAFARDSAALAFTGGQMDVAWRMAVPDAACFQQSFGWMDSGFLWWRDRQGLLGFWEDDEDGKYLLVSLVACELADFHLLLADVRRYATQRGCAKIDWNALLAPELDVRLKSAGFVRADDEVNFQFERIHPTRLVP
jgi:GNAT superfamily N-acetyltransferase